MYGQCKLGTYTYAVNPVANPNPPVRSVGVADTLQGRLFTDYGASPSRQESKQTWPLLDAATYAALAAQAAIGGTLPYIDDDGTHFTVIAMPPTYDRKTAGGDSYVNVSMTLYIVSSP